MAGVLATWQLALSLQITLVVVPVALYFLVLGLLNSQRRPQLLTGRTDFTLLMAAVSPLCAVPLLSLVGANAVNLCLVTVAALGVILLLAPRDQHGWVIYNINLQEALRAIGRAAARSGTSFSRQGGSLHFADGTVVRVSAFPMLRNVSLSVRSAANPPEWMRRFEAALAAQIAQIEVAASPMAVSFVLVATAMIVAPLVLLADRMPEMVRILTDLLG